MNLEGMVQGFRSKLDGLRVEPYVRKLYDEKVPGQLRGQFKPEYEFALERAKSLDKDIQELIDEHVAYYKKNPLELADAKLIDLLKFRDPSRQKKFVENVHYSVEDLAYALKVGGYDLYRWLDVKCNTPIIGHFARQKFEESGLPSTNTELSDKVDEVKNGLLGGWMMLNVDHYDMDDEPLSSDELEKRYKQNITDPRKHSALEAWKKGESVSLGDKLYGSNDLSSRERFHRNVSYSFSPYNGFFSGCIGFVGSVFDYCFGWMWK